MYTHIYTYMYTHTYTRICLYTYVYVCVYIMHVYIIRVCVYIYTHICVHTHTHNWVSQVALVLKDPPASAQDIEGTALIPGSGRSPGEGNGDPLQYSCLGNPMDRGVWWATTRAVTKELDRT